MTLKSVFSAVSTTSFRSSRGIIGKRVNLRRREDELAQDGRALHDVGMVLPVGKRERVVRKVDEVRLAADRLELPRRIERVGKRDLVDGDAADVQVAYRLEDDAMGRTEEVLRLQLQHQLLDSLSVEHGHAARTDCSASMFWGNGLFCGVDCGAKSELRGVLERLSGICVGFLLGALMSFFENSFNRCILPHRVRSRREVPQTPRNPSPKRARGLEISVFAMCDALFGSSLGLFSGSSCFLGGSLDSLFLFRSLDSLGRSRRSR